MTWLIVTTGIVVFIILIITWTENVDAFLVSIPLTISSFTLGASLVEDYTERKPSALDVYRGRTTLEITSINGVPKDSVVIFKSKEK